MVPRVAEQHSEGKMEERYILGDHPASSIHISPSLIGHMYKDCMHIEMNCNIFFPGNE